MPSIAVGAGSAQMGAASIRAGNSMRRSLSVALTLWAATRLLLTIVAVVSFIRIGVPVPWARMWVQWDANIYLSIVSQGYQPPVAVTGFENGQSNLNFFPMAPLGVEFVHWFVPNVVLAGLVFANVCAIAAGVVLHRLALARHGRLEADWAVASLYVLPASFVLSAPMSEAPFVLLSAAAALLATRGRCAGAAIAAALLSITRVTGILYGAGLALDWLVARLGGARRSPRELFYYALIPLLPLCFMFVMLRVTGDALAPLHSERAFWHQQFGYPFQSLLMFAWSIQPRLRLQSLLSCVMIGVLLRHGRPLTWGEWLFTIGSILASSSSYSASESLLRYTIGLYPVHLAFGRLGATSLIGRGLVISLGIVNAALMTAWSHGSDVVV